VLLRGGIRTGTNAHLQHTSIYHTLLIYAKLLYTLHDTTLTYRQVAMSYSHKQDVLRSDAVLKNYSGKIWIVRYYVGSGPSFDTVRYGWTTNETLVKTAGNFERTHKIPDYTCEEIDLLTVTSRGGGLQSDKEWINYGDHITTTGRKFDPTLLCSYQRAWLIRRCACSMGGVSKEKYPACIHYGQSYL
jgi:hypothetical protein